MIKGISDGPDKQELLKLIIQEKTKQSGERTKQLKIQAELEKEREKTKQSEERTKQLKIQAELEKEKEKEKTKQSEERTKQLQIENESKQGMLITTTTITSTHYY